MRLFSENKRESNRKVRDVGAKSDSRLMILLSRLDGWTCKDLILLLGRPCCYLVLSYLQTWLQLRALLETRNYESSLVALCLVATVIVKHPSSMFVHLVRSHLKFVMQ